MTIYTQRLILAIPGEPAGAQVLAYNQENREHLAPCEPPWTPRALDVRAIAEALQRDTVLAADGRAYRFLIFDRSQGLGGKVIGRLNFTDVVRGAFQACYMGYSLAHDMQGRGYMTEAARAGISCMFETAMLHRIMANYMPENARSAAVLERLGFVIEGTARNYLFIAGAWRDHVLTSLTNPREITPAF